MLVESDHDAMLTGGAAGGHAAAVEGAVEGVVERFGVFAPAVVAVEEAAVSFVGFGVGLGARRGCSPFGGPRGSILARGVMERATIGLCW